MWWITIVVALASAQKDRVPDRVGRVAIEGNTDTPDRVIRRCVFLWPGQVLDHTRVTAAPNRLKKTGLFEEASVEVLPNEFDGAFKDVLIRVKERLRNWALFAARDVVVGLVTLDPALLWDAVYRVRLRLP